MATLSRKEDRLKIYKAIMALGDVWGFKTRNSYNGLDKVKFLERIWPLYLMSSSDSRFTNAAEDARKHLIDNDDWDDDYTFLDRFRLLNCSEEEFIKFVNTVVSLDVRESEQEVDRYVGEIEKHLPKGYEFHRETDDDGKERSVLGTIKPHDPYEYPIGIPHNNITFFVNQLPTEYPSLQLMSDNWDDYGYKTTFNLYYHISEDACRHIGLIKICKEKEATTKTVIPQNFTILPDSFCSLMQKMSCYKLLKEYRPNDYPSILYALRDAAYYPTIRERFETMAVFKASLLRNYETAEVLNGARMYLERNEAINDWSFEFDSELPYTTERVPIRFQFGDLCDEGNYHRIKALIGPNGAGKSSILKSLVKKLIGGDEGFRPSPPVFNNVIVISFSIFDSFFKLHGKSVLNYTYCGLHDTKNTILSEEEREARLRIALRWLAKSNSVITGSLLSKFLSALKIFFPAEWVDSIYVFGDGLQIEKIIADTRKMSSGESMIFNLVASLYANIRKNSLIVFDELEVHLHPRAIRQMMSLLFRITRQFDSACILATHSAIVVQELLADNVTIVEKIVDSVEGEEIKWRGNTRGLSRESLAENLSSVNKEIFGEYDLQPHYISFIRQNAERAKSFDELLDSITSENLPASLPLYMVARGIYEKQKK